MSPDDPRHGRVAGASQHWRDGERPCDPCRIAANRSRKRYRYLTAVGKSAIVDSTGVVRRVRALQALGWTLPQIASAGRIAFPTLQKPLYRSGACRPATARAVDRAYERLSMSLPPEETRQQRRDAAYARNLAARKEWAPPLAWNDIDDPDERPVGQRHSYGADYDSNDLVDEATVLRILAGETLRSNQAERHEVMRRWLAMGNSERSLCIRMGWKDGRYVSREGDAA